VLSLLSRPNPPLLTSRSPPSPTPLPRLTLRLVGESQPASARATSLPTRADRDCDQSRCRSIAARVRESRARACARGPGAESASRQAWGWGTAADVADGSFAWPVRGEAPGGLRRSRGRRRRARRRAGAATGASWEWIASASSAARCASPAAWCIPLRAEPCRMWSRYVRGWRGATRPTAGLRQKPPSASRVMVWCVLVVNRRSSIPTVMGSL
jgi:hypothetical protein